VSGSESEAAAAAADTRGARPYLRGIRAAVVTLTRVPVGGFPYSQEDWRWSAGYLPLVGAFIGVAVACAWIASSRAGHLVAAVVSVGVAALVTGAMHEDGLADTVDALGGGATRERVLLILKDSRIGVFGAVALIVALLLRVTLLARLGATAPFAIVLTSSASRVAPVWLMAALPYVTDPAVAKSRATTRAGWMQVTLATCWPLFLIAGLFFVQVLTARELAAASLAVIVSVAACAARFRARVGGITGDFLGATQQVSECAMLLALALARGGPA
jgi:adenosylcobinamide-GDP ribazoletransferase